MTYQEITDLYQEIGRTFRSLGAQRVYLMHSRTVSHEEHEVELEIVLDTEEEAASFLAEAKKRWPSVCMKISRVTDDMNRDEELMEDAIQI